MPISKIDRVDCLLLEELAGRARAPFQELGRRLHISAAQAQERLQRLEENGFIRRYTIELVPEALGYSLQAIVQIRPMPGRMKPVEKLIEGTPEIVECDKVSGDDYFIARLFARSMKHLDSIVERLATDATISTAITVQGQIIRRRPPPVEPM